MVDRRIQGFEKVRRVLLLLELDEGRQVRDVDDLALLVFEREIHFLYEQSLERIQGLLLVKPDVASFEHVIYLEVKQTFGLLRQDIF